MRYYSWVHFVSFPFVNLICGLNSFDQTKWVHFVSFPFVNLICGLNSFDQTKWLIDLLLETNTTLGERHQLADQTMQATDGGICHTGRVQHKVI